MSTGCALERWGMEQGRARAGRSPRKVVARLGPQNSGDSTTTGNSALAGTTGGSMVGSGKCALQAEAVVLHGGTDRGSGKAELAGEMAARPQNPGDDTSTGHSALVDTTGDSLSSSVKRGLLAEAGALQGGVDRGSEETAKAKISGSAGHTTAEAWVSDAREQAEWDAMLLGEFPMEGLTMQERDEMFWDAVMDASHALYPEMPSSEEVRAARERRTGSGEATSLLDGELLLTGGGLVVAPAATACDTAVIVDVVSGPPIGVGGVVAADEQISGATTGDCDFDLASSGHLESACVRQEARVTKTGSGEAASLFDGELLLIGGGLVVAPAATACDTAVIVDVVSGPPTGKNGVVAASVQISGATTGDCDFDLAKSGQLESACVPHVRGGLARRVGLASVEGSSHAASSSWAVGLAALGNSAAARLVVLSDGASGGLVALGDVLLLAPNDDAFSELICVKGGASNDGASVELVALSDGAVVETVALSDGVVMELVASNDGAVVELVVPNDGASVRLVALSDGAVVETVARDGVVMELVASNDGAVVELVVPNDGVVAWWVASNDGVAAWWVASNDGVIARWFASIVALNDSAVAWLVASNDGVAAWWVASNDGVAAWLVASNDGVAAWLVASNDGLAVSAFRAARACRSSDLIE